MPAKKIPKQLPSNRLRKQQSKLKQEERVPRKKPTHPIGLIMWKNHTEKTVEHIETGIDMSTN